MRPRSIAPIVSAGILLGCGMGGSFDGIVFHQILQWHNMLSSVRPPIDLLAMKYNMLWDGAFHAATWVVTGAGVVQLWCAGRRNAAWWSTSAFVGACLLGWGLFNTLEGTLNHFISGLHHVRPGPNQLAWDAGFLCWGVLMLACGSLLVRAAR